MPINISMHIFEHVCNLILILNNLSILNSIIVLIDVLLISMRNISDSMRLLPFSYSGITVINLS